MVYYCSLAVSICCYCLRQARAKSHRHNSCLACHYIYSYSSAAGQTDRTLTSSTLATHLLPGLMISTSPIDSYGDLLGCRLIAAD